MKRGMNGFTLLELLIAAALVGILAMFATQSFRRTASDIRVENAKRGADTIAAAAYRFDIAYPGKLTTGALSATNDPGDCDPNSSPANPLQKLVDCEFLENRSYWDTNEFDLTLNGPGVVVVTAKSNRIIGFSGYTTGEEGFVQVGY